MNSLKKVSCEFEIIEFDDKKSFSIKNKEEKITIYDKALATELIDKKFNTEYKKLLYIIMDINNSDDSTESDGLLVRDKIDELKNVILNKYSKYISKELLNRYIKMIMILEEKLVIPEKSRGR